MREGKKVKMKEKGNGNREEKVEKTKDVKIIKSGG